MAVSNVNKFIEITDEDIEEVAKLSSKIVIDIFNLLAKTVKAKLVYPASSKLPQQFKQNLFSSLSTILEEHDELAFKVESDTISYGETEVYKATSKNENFAHPFFRDGILEFKFKKGVTFEELESFVDIVSQMTRSALLDDDAATLLWEAGFDHISYELMDDFLDIETFEYGTESLKTGRSPSDSDIKKILEKDIDLNLTEEDFDLDSAKNKSRNVPPAYRNVEEKVSRFLSDLAVYSESERKAIDELLREDIEFDYVKYAIDILFEILGMETDSAGYNDTLDLVAKVGTDFIKTGDFKSAVTVIERSTELDRVLSSVKDPKHERMQDFILRFAASEKIRALVDYLNKANDVNFEDLTNYLMLLPWQAIDPLVWALGELEHYPARRAICQALEILAQYHSDILGKGIQSPRWYVVRNIVSILGKIGDPRAFGFLKKSMQHPDIRVRKETILAAAKIITDEAGAFLISALDDQDEKIQTLALRAIVNRKITQAADVLRTIITKKKFKERPVEQIREFLAGFAILGGNEAFEPLKKIIQQWSPIRSEKIERVKIYSIRALGLMRTPEATALLENKAVSRNKKMADAARRTLIKVKRGEEIAW